MRKISLVTPLAAILLAPPLDAAAQAYPSRPIRMFVGYAPGGGTDIIARLVAVNLQKRIGQPVIVDNKPGAGGNIASELTAGAAADGYTLLMAANTIAINPYLYSKLDFDVRKDLTGVALIANSPVLVVVNPSQPIKSITELIAFAKANPGKLNHATPGIGTPQHLAAELFKSMTQTDIVHVPYKGGAPAMAAVAANEVQVSFAAINSAWPLVQGGRLRALAIGDAKRIARFKEIPTIGETVPGYNVGIWYGIMAPGRTPREILHQLNRELGAVVQIPEVQERMASQGYEVAIGTPEEMTATVHADLDKWAKVVKPEN
jgi:tripartite-type tricarboxylate transporter receptor subunit TctC